MITIFRGSRGRLRLYIIAIVAVVVGLVLVAVYFNQYAPTASLTVTGGVVHILEGQGSHGWWLGPPERNFTAGSGGFPQTINVGSIFSIAVMITTTDVTSHTISSISAAAPFSFDHANAALPCAVPPGTDDNLVITIHAPGGSGSYAFNVTVQVE
jgi:hypothetical protein